MKKVLGALAIVAVFIGFPIIGMVIFWQDGHKKLEESSRPFVETTLQDSLTTWDYEALKMRSTYEFQENFPPEEFDALHESYGELESIGEIKNERTWAATRGETIWHFGEYSATAQFENGEGRVQMVTARKASETADEIRQQAAVASDEIPDPETLDRHWKVDHLEIVPL